MRVPDADTIVACATPPGRGGVGIVRISGPRARLIATGMLGTVPTARRAQFMPFLDGGAQPLDAGLALYFPGPQSFTGEDVLELHGHGGPVVMDLLVARAVELGARHARPGEFTERAFLNDKLDLAQAEAIADLIDAGSTAAARAAMRSLTGEFSAEVRALVTAITGLRVFVEAAIDFPDEDVEFLGGEEVTERLVDIEQRFARIEAAARQGSALREGLNVVIAGKPNAGKSSLLNRLAGYEAAIVTEVPGTTRDVLRERIHVDGLPIHVIDTAGLRDTTDIVEVEGVRRARAEIGRADLILYVVDASGAVTSATLAQDLATLPRGIPVTVLLNKVDQNADRDTLPGRGTGLHDAGAKDEPVQFLGISALTGEGLDQLRARLKQAAGYLGAEAGAYSARRRHLDALDRARQCVERGARLLASRSSFELVAEELRLAQEALGEITGAVTSDELLGRIFSSFCIGK